MRRRTILATVGGALAGGFLVSNYKRELPAVDVSIGSGGNASNSDGSGKTTPTPKYPLTQSLPDPFSKIEFYKDGTAKLYFVEIHEADGWYLIYHQYDRVDKAIYVCESSTKTDGAVTVSLIEALQNEQTAYPDRKFNLVAARGSFPRCDVSAGFSLIQERVQTATIQIPDEFTITPTPTPTPEDGDTVGFE